MDLLPLWPWPADDPRRFKRNLNSGDFPAPKGICCWCGGTITGRRQRYCSGACSEQVYFRIQPRRCESAVLLRDGGKCAICRKLVSPSAIEVRLRQLHPNGRRPYHTYLEQRIWRALFNQATDWYRRTRSGPGAPHLFELDHIKPVIEGGGGCGPEGYRILCRACHPIETGKLRRRLNAARRPQQSLPLESGAHLSEDTCLCYGTPETPEKTRRASSSPCSPGS